MINAMCDPMIGMFDPLYITSNTDVYLSIKYTERILSVTAPNKYFAIFWFVSRH